MIAKAYQEYRITKVDITFKPSYDTFPTSGGGGIAVPALYGVVDKFGAYSLNYTDLYALKQAGAKARRMDDKVFTISFKPAVLLSSSDAGSPPGAPVNTTAGAVKVSPWLPTNASAGDPVTAWTPNSVDHRGYIFYIDQPNAPTDQFVAQVEIVVHYQFRKALTQAPAPVAEDKRGRIDVDTMTEVGKVLPLGGS